MWCRRPALRQLRSSFATLVTTASSTNTFLRQHNQHSFATLATSARSPGNQHSQHCCPSFAAPSPSIRSSGDHHTYHCRIMIVEPTTIACSSAAFSLQLQREDVAAWVTIARSTNNHRLISVAFSLQLRRTNLTAPPLGRSGHGQSLEQYP